MSLRYGIRKIHSHPDVRFGNETQNVEQGVQVLLDGSPSAVTARSTHARAPEVRRQLSPARSDAGVPDSRCCANWGGETECWVRDKLSSEPRRGGRFFGDVLILLAIILALGHPQRASAQESHSPDYLSIQKKLAWLKMNATKTHPDPRPTDLTEPEVNAYFNEGGVKLPKGVSHLRLSSHDAVIDGHANVDFEQIMQGRGSNNPFYSLFSGSHDVHAVAQATGANGTGTIHVQSVELDGVQLPQFALQFFVQHYITPKYPNVGITSTFKLPLRIVSAVVETGKVRLIQR